MSYVTYKLLEVCVKTKPGPDQQHTPTEQQSHRQQISYEHRAIHTRGHTPNQTDPRLARGRRWGERGHANCLNQTGPRPTTHTNRTSDDQSHQQQILCVYVTMKQGFTRHTIMYGQWGCAATGRDIKSSQVCEMPMPSTQP